MCYYNWELSCGKEGKTHVHSSVKRKEREKEKIDYWNSNKLLDFLLYCNEVIWTG
jgi:hypothetical protein